MPRPKTTAGSAYKSLVREVEAMRVLDHPHVLRLEHAIDTTTQDFCFLVTTQSDRDLLQEIQQRGALDETVARKYWEGLMDAVTACHAAGIAHRESVRPAIVDCWDLSGFGCSIKPENLLIGWGGILKLADFGFANTSQGDDWLMRTVSHCEAGSLLARCVCRCAAQCITLRLVSRFEYYYSIRVLPENLACCFCRAL